MKYLNIWMLNKSKVEFFRRSRTCYSMFKCLWIEFKTTIGKICDAFDLKTIINLTYHSTRWHTFDLWVTKKFRCSPETLSRSSEMHDWISAIRLKSVQWFLYLEKSSSNSLKFESRILFTVIISVSVRFKPVFDLALQ